MFLQRCTRAYRNTTVMCMCINVHPTTVYYGAVNTIILIEVHVY